MAQFPAYKTGIPARAGGAANLWAGRIGGPRVRHMLSLIGSRATGISAHMGSTVMVIGLCRARLTATAMQKGQPV